jgi:hypothetical protein|eukprot:4869379-Prymnesium_polylepis.2
MACGVCAPMCFAGVYRTAQDPVNFDYHLPLGRHGRRTVCVPKLVQNLCLACAPPHTHTQAHTNCVRDDRAVRRRHVHVPAEGRRSPPNYAHPARRVQVQAAAAAGDAWEALPCAEGWVVPRVGSSTRFYLSRWAAAALCGWHLLVRCLAEPEAQERQRCAHAQHPHMTRDACACACGLCASWVAPAVLPDDTSTLAL